MAYTLKGLENGIVGCKKNIAALESAIEKERNTIKEYRIMMDSIEESDRRLKEAEAGVHVEMASGD